MQIETVERFQNMESRFDQVRPPGLYKQCNVLRHVGITTLIFSFKKVELLKFVECHPGGKVKSSNPKTQKKLPKLKAGKRHAQFLQTIAALLRILRKCT
jgi:hypothetical protein